MLQSFSSLMQQRSGCVHDRHMARVLRCKRAFHGCVMNSDQLISARERNVRTTPVLIGISRLRLAANSQRCSAGGQARGCPRPQEARQASLSETARAPGSMVARLFPRRCALICRGPFPGAADRCRPDHKGVGFSRGRAPSALRRPPPEMARLTSRAGCDRTAQGSAIEPATAKAREAHRREVARRARPSAKPGSPPPGRGSPPRLPPQGPNPRSPRAAAATSLCLDSRCRAAGPQPAEQQRDTLP